MTRVIFLDTAPLSILTDPKFPAVTRDAIRWSVDLMAAGHSIMVPAIADYELRRELTRLNKVNSLSLLDTFNAAISDRYLPLTDSALKRAAVLWALARSGGTLPADPKELNGDLLITAQVLDYQIAHGLPKTEIVIATVNVGHLSLFAPADLWANITP